MERFNQFIIDCVRLIDNRPLSEINEDDLQDLASDLYLVVKMIDEEISKRHI